MSLFYSACWNNMLMRNVDCMQMSSWLTKIIPFKIASFVSVQQLFCQLKLCMNFFQKIYYSNIGHASMQVMSSAFLKQRVNQYAICTSLQDIFIAPEMMAGQLQNTCWMGNLNLNSCYLIYMYYSNTRRISNQYIVLGYIILIFTLILSVSTWFE